MSQSFTKLWIHVIWATKNRQKLIDFSIEKNCMILFMKS